MKKTYLFAIAIIGIAIAIIISTAGDASTYVTFSEAKTISVKSDGKAKVHVVGTLQKDPQGNVIGLFPSEDKLSFSFILIDENGKSQEVFYYEPMPTDFKRSEKVVIIGGYVGDVFVADKILLKCPSKYQEQEVNAGV